MLATINAIAPATVTDSQAQTPPYKNPRLPVEQRVADLLSRMTLEEKIAQLTCLWMNRPQVKPQTDFSTDRGDFSPERAGQVMKYGIGQIARQLLVVATGVMIVLHATAQRVAARLSGPQLSSEDAVG